MNLTQVIGDVRITRIQEMSGLGFTFKLMFPNYNKTEIEKHKHWLSPNYMGEENEQMYQSQSSWIIETPQTTIFIDPGNGNDRHRPGMERFSNLQTPYLEKIAQSGVTLEDINIVLCTHFHSDHFGWSTQLVDGKFVATFPNAKYLYSKSDFDWCENMDPSQEGQIVDGGERIVCEKGMLPGITAATKPAIEDSLYPILDSGHLTLIPQEDRKIDDYVTLKNAAGHTPGTFRVDIESNGEKAIISGDIMHHPIQVYNWDWNSIFCVIPEQAKQQRYALLKDCSETNALLLPTHFNNPTACRIKETEKDKFELIWENM
ncbi:MBL fold metallo-hydrolase [Photobacterium damselae]|nr:MBL fold metallo-hydrolase [Photobacterium damselae]